MLNCTYVGSNDVNIELSNPNKSKNYTLGINVTDPN